MTVLGDFLSPEAGQRRRAWLDEKLGAADEAMRYYLGPTGVPDKLKAVADALNYTDAGDMTAAADASRGFWESPSVGNAAELAAAGGALAIPFVGARMIDDGVDVLGDALRSGKDDIGRFAADESGGIRAWHGSPHDFDRFSIDRLGTGSSDAIDGRGINLTDDVGEAVSYKRPDLRSNPFAGEQNQQFSGSGHLYEVNIGAENGDFIPTRRPVSELPDDVKNIVASRFRPDDEFANNRDLGFYLSKDSTLQDEIAAAGYKGFLAERYGNKNYIVFDDRLTDILSKNGEKTPQGKAQEILDMLKAGRASEVTDDMMAAADPMYLYDNYDLPMDEASRMGRAREMGFDTDKPWYHGTPDNREIDAGFATKYEQMIPERERVGPYFLTDSRNVAATYADDSRAFDYQNADPEVLRLYSRASDPLNVNARGDTFRGIDALNVRNAMLDKKGSGPAMDNFDRELMKIQRGEDEGRLSTDALGALAKRFGFDTVDVRNVRDTYTGDGPQSTVRMFTDPTSVRRTTARFDPRLSHLRNLSAGVAGAAALGMNDDEPQIMSGVLGLPSQSALRDYLK